jgi:SAM-dependent methyltransferase
MREHHRKNRQAYDRDAEALARVYNAMASADVLPGLSERLPQGERLRALDLGCGSGRDAFWMAAEKGFDVVAVDASAAMLAQARRLKAHERVTYVRDDLPGLAKVRRDEKARGDTGFDVFVMSAVWMHLQPDERAQTMRHIAAMARPGALLYVSLRHGPAPEDRPMFDNSVAEIIALAALYGARAEVAGADRDRQGRAGVKWEYVALRF